MQNWSLTNRLSCLKSIVQYFDENQTFDDIRRQCIGSIDHESQVYIFTININLHDLYEKSVLLADKVSNTPVQSSNLFHEVIFEFIKCQQLLPTSVMSSQVRAKLYITHLPCKGFQICSLSDLTKCSHYKGFVKLTGIVSGFSSVTKYTQSTRYVCLDSNCDGHYGNHFIRIHIPGALETQTVRSDFICSFCGGILEETISARIVSEKMIAEVLPIKIYGYQRKESLNNQLTQAVPVILRDDLVNKIQIGKSYVIIGLCRSDYYEEEITITLEANSITEVQKNTSSQLKLITGDLQKIVSFIHRGNNENGWRCISLLALHFANNIVPPGKMIKLRILLLISLVLYPQENKLHILAIGRETEQALMVMNYAKQFSCRSCPISSATPLNGKVNNKYRWALYFIEGGSLLLSRGGVCFFGEIGLWKKARKEQIKSALNSNSVMLELATKYTESLPQTITFPLECQSWAIYDVGAAKSQAESSNSDIFIGCSTGELTNSFLDAFNIVAFLDDNVSSYDQDFDCEYLDFMWSQYSSPNIEETPFEMETDDVEKYLSLAHHQETKMTVEAETLLQSYFSASRLARTSGFGSSSVPPSALITLTSLAVGIAKLQLHQVVKGNDAVMAIYLYEEYLTSRWGLTVLNVQAQPNIPSNEIDNFLGIENDMLMEQFKIRLQQFCMRVKDSINFNQHLKLSNGFVVKEE